MHELTFVNNVSNWINDILDKRRDLLFEKAIIEESVEGKHKRRDLTIYDREGKLALTGEIKLPDKPDGMTPYNEAVVTNAHSKADNAGAEYFFTWNVNRLVLWKTFARGVPLIQRDQRLFEVVDVHDNKQLSLPLVQDKIKRFLEDFLTLFADIYRGVKILPVKPLDERFIEMLDTALDTIVFHTVNALYKNYQEDLDFRGELMNWMVNEMGWTHSEETLTIDLERAAKTSCYRLVNKLMFYDALRRRFADLPVISFSPLQDTGEKMNGALNQFFERAMVASGDYETVYLRGFADQLPFMSSIALNGWRNLIEHIDAYDFTRLNYDIVGRVFERLIGPKERHRYGQHYTAPDIVDLINGFCIRRADAIVADPACGGGTFLVRAYARKKHLSDGALSHNDLLKQIYGVDISPFAAHLALINLASRDLDSEPNYPLVTVEDFFNVRRGNPTFQMPAHGAVKVNGLGDERQQSIPIDRIDAVVGNPPYVRQEEIDDVFRVKDAPKKSYKKFLRELFYEEWGTDTTRPSARSDLYIYFWPHAAHFLPEGGYIGLLTGSGWLDNQYGFKLQEFILERFQVLAVMESAVEPWFTEARVNTTVTILRRTDDAQARADNDIKFILLRQKLSEILPQTENETKRQQAVDALVNEIEGLTQNTNGERWRVRVVNQGELTLAGWEFDDEDAEPPAQWNGDWNSLRAQGGKYVGTKWGIHLRAPDLFFDILDAFGDKLVPLREVAKVKYGVKSGADKFFYVQDRTDEIDNETLAELYGLTRGQARTVRVVRAGDGSAHFIEARYLQPLVFSVMEVEGLAIDPTTLKKKVLIVSDAPEDLQGTHVLDYIHYGEREGIHQRSTCASRVSDNPDNPRQWYDLRPPEPGALFWAQSHRYRHIVPLNREKHICNKRFFNIYPKGELSPELLSALLNSTLTLFFKNWYARNMGEGFLDTDVVVTKMIPVPCPANLTESAKARLLEAIKPLIRRPSDLVYPMGDELEQADRAELDEAIFAALGVEDPAEQRQWRERLYSELKRLYKRKRELEEITMANRAKAARKKRTASARTLAKEVWREMDKSRLRRFPDDFVPPGVVTKEHRLPEGEVQIGRELFNGGGALGTGYIMIDEELRFVGSTTKAEFVQKWQEAGNKGAVSIPKDDAECQRILDEYAQYRAEIQEEVVRWARSRTADDRLQTQVINLLWQYIGDYVRTRRDEGGN